MALRHDNNAVSERAAPTTSRKAIGATAALPGATVTTEDDLARIWATAAMPTASTVAGPTMTAGRVAAAAMGNTATATADSALVTKKEKAD